MYSPRAPHSEIRIRPRQGFEGCICLSQNQGYIYCVFTSATWGMVGRNWIGNGWTLDFSTVRAWERETWSCSQLLCCLYALISSHHRCLLLSAQRHSLSRSGVLPGRLGWQYETSEGSQLGQGGTELQLWAVVPPTKDGQLLRVSKS